ncbi:cyclophilin-like fold protein [Tessaracoccus palaemonis]|uniref:Cyclophilin-like domain-containing protein n=1 Tax=Tessaracoccus palaemonis TaxID=2829499 RepID=A0ABX8SN23_9ACTN|nr:cyclophilin-like fold protein [Tessaracoccus palaemonis]QXT63797.1 hypothetical protein KDB89_04810 [Tessaracoccus palaemonis]
MNRTAAWITLATNCLLALPACSAPMPAQSVDRPTAVSMTGTAAELERGSSGAAAVIDDTPAGRAFAASLPLTIDVGDSFGLALVGPLPSAPSVNGLVRSTQFTLGEIAYAPDSGSLAVFYDDHGASVAPPGVVRLGVVTDGLHAVATASGPVTIRLAG